MIQAALNFNPYPKNIFTPGTDSYRLYEYLREHGEITTWQIHNIVKVETARIRSDIRPFLRKNGMDYDCKSIPGVKGNRMYKIKYGG
jgi:hypothetical protein